MILILQYNIKRNLLHMAIRIVVEYLSKSISLIGIQILFKVLNINLKNYKYNISPSI